jgi:predicted transposase/invertase (TIGR01784 family)
MSEGASYSELRPAICICLVTEPLFTDSENAQWEFRLHDVKHRRSYGDQLQLHLVELSKYDLQERSISKASRLEQWVYFLNEAQNFNEARLRRLFPDPIFQKAIGVLAMVSRKPAYRMMYDDRQKAKLDQLSALKDAATEAEARGEHVVKRVAKRVAKHVAKHVDELRHCSRYLGFLRRMTKLWRNFP